MAYIRVLDMPTPAAPKGAVWEARALLEAPSPDGPWEPIAATAALDGPILSEHAQHNPGWYRVQWHDSARRSFFSHPVQLEGDDLPMLTAAVTPQVSGPGSLA